MEGVINAVGLAVSGSIAALSAFIIGVGVVLLVLDLFRDLFGWRPGASDVDGS